MNATAERWSELYDAFDPRRPVVDPAWRAERPYSPARRLLDGLRAAPRPKKFLVKGTSGNGKTTELLHVGAEAAERRMVVFFDFEQHFRSTMRDEAALQSAQPWELLFLVGAAMWQAGRALGIPWEDRHAAELGRAYAALLGPEEDGETPKVDVAAVGSALTLLVGGAVAAASGAAVVPLALAAATPGLSALAKVTKWEIPFRIGGRKPKLDQDPQVARLLDAVGALILHAQGAHRPVLLVLDGLDRLDRDAAARHFQRSGLLADLPCSVILTAPRSLSRTLTRFDATLVLENVPVIDRRDPRRPGPGAQFFHDVWQRRAGPIADALSPAQLDRLAWASGGLLRHFCRLVRGLVELAYADPVARFPDAWLDEVIDERRRELEDDMTREEFALLAAVVQDPRHELPASPFTEALLDEHRLVPYPNDSTWYFPHPLLTLHKVPLPPSTASAG